MRLGWDTRARPEESKQRPIKTAMTVKQHQSQFRPALDAYAPRWIKKKKKMYSIKISLISYLLLKTTYRLLEGQVFYLVIKRK